MPHLILTPGQVAALEAAVSGAVSFDAAGPVTGLTNGVAYRAISYSLSEVFTPVAAVPAPTQSALPNISGAARVGQTLAGQPGVWTGSPSLVAQWLRAGLPIPGALGQTYVVQEADLGALIALRVTATNAGGTAVATSAGLGPVTAATVQLTDTFTTGTSVSVLAYVGESGQPWALRAGDAVTPATVSDGACIAFDHPAARVVSRGPVLAPDHYAQATFVRGGAVNSAVAIAVRVSAIGEAYWFRFNGATNEWQLFRSNPSQATQLGAFSGPVAGWAVAGDRAVARLEANGSTLRALVNGTQVITATDTTYSDGRAGIRAFRVGGQGQSLVDFSAGDLGALPEPTAAVWSVSQRDRGADLEHIPVFAGTWDITPGDSGAAIQSHPESV